MNALQLFQIIRFSTTLLIGIVLAKVFSLSVAEIALYEVVLFLGNFASFFWISAGQKSLLSLFPSHPIAEQRKVLFNIFLLLVGLATIAATGLYLSQEWLLQHLTNYQQIPFLPLICTYLLFNAPAQLIEYIYVLKKQSFQLLRYGIIIHFLQLSAVVIPIYCGSGVEGIFQCLVAWSIIKFIWIIKLLTQHATFKFEWNLQQKILLFIAPLSLHMLLGSGMEYVDGFLVTRFFEDQQLFAIFRYGARELPFVNILISALAATLIPAAIENEKKAITTIKEKTYQLSLWMYPLTIGLMLTSPYLFTLVYNSDFAASATIFNVYLLIISSRILLPQVFLYSRQHTSVLVGSAIIEVIINLSLSIYWLGNYGLEGIAMATVIAYIVNKVILMSYVYFKFNIAPNQYMKLPVYFFWNGLLIGVFCWTLS